MPITSEILVDIFNESKHYIDTRTSLLKIELVEKISLMTTKILVFVTLLFLILLFLLFAGFSLAAQLSIMLHNDAVSFLLVALLFSVCMLIFIFLGSRIIYRYISKQLLRIMYTPQRKQNDTK